MIFDVATSDTRKLVRAAHKGLDGIYREGFSYAKAGIMLCDIMPTQQVQSTLFSVMDSAESIKLMHSIDGLNKRFGKRTIFFAGENTKQAWAMKRGFITPAYTTSWREMPIVY
jgi:DNA polymerase V